MSGKRPRSEGEGGESRMTSSGKQIHSGGSKKRAHERKRQQMPAGVTCWLCWAAPGSPLLAEDWRLGTEE